MRMETRKQRYNKKLQQAISLPVSLVTINFKCDENLAFLIRTAACCGIDTIHVIGSIPTRKKIFNSSGSLVDYIKLKKYKNPSEFLKYANKSNYTLISAELTDKAINLFDYKFDFSGHTCIILGNESIGVPTQLLINSDIVYIPMWGPGFCFNTSQTGTAFVSEYCRQYYLRK